MEVAPRLQQSESSHNGKEETHDASCVVETPGSLTSPQGSCGLKQSRLLFPHSMSASPPTSATPSAVPVVTSHLPEMPTPKEETSQNGVNIQLVEAASPSSMSSALSAVTKASNSTVKAKVRLSKSEREAVKQQREKVREETLALREEERLRREEDRLKREQDKKARRERRDIEEKEKKERRETKEREKRERQEKKEVEKRKKEEERKKREEERKMREEEKRQAELEKQQSTEEKLRRQKGIEGFFSKRPKSETHMNEAPNEIKRSSLPRPPLSDTAACDQMMQNQIPSSSYLSECRQCRVTKQVDKKVSTRIPRGPSIEDKECDDVMITSSPNLPPKPQMKLLQFHSNVRPAYFGSWCKHSEVISGRTPFRKDTSLLDYEFDSDDEWEEEEPGESVSSASEGEDDSGEEPMEEEEEEDGFFVPHGYLSEDEGDRSDAEGGLAGAEMDKVKAKARVWEAEFQRTCQPKKVVCIGCVWAGGRDGEGDGEGEGSGGRDFLSMFSALVLTESPVRVEPAATSVQQETQGSSATDALRRPVPEEAMPDLIRLVHNSTAGLTRLTKTFRILWGTKLQNKRDSNHQPMPTSRSSPPAMSTEALPQTGAKETDCENASGISKRQVDMKIQQIAVKGVRASSTKSSWCVHDSVLQQYDIDPAQLAPLLTPTPKSQQHSAEKSCSPETPSAKKGTKRRAAGTPSVKSLFEAIAKSPQYATTSTSSAEAPKEKRQKVMEGTPTTLPVANGKVTSTGGGREPPKKRIRLESEPLNMKSQDISKLFSPAGTNATPRHQEVIVIDNFEKTDPVSRSANTKENPFLSCSSNVIPAELTTTAVMPSRKMPVVNQSTVQNAKPVPTVSNALTQTMKLTALLSNKTCLQECTNQQTEEMGRGGGGGVRERINWKELILNSKTDGKVVVTAEIH